MRSIYVVRTVCFYQWPMGLWKYVCCMISGNYVIQIASALDSTVGVGISFHLYRRCAKVFVDLTVTEHKTSPCHSSTCSKTFTSYSNECCYSFGLFPASKVRVLEQFTFIKTIADESSFLNVTLLFRMSTFDILFFKTQANYKPTVVGYLKQFFPK